MTGSTYAYMAEVERRRQRALRRSVIDALAAADTPDATLFTRRDSLVDSIEVLKPLLARAATFRVDPAKELRADAHLRPFRVATSFRAINIDTWPPRCVFTMSDLRQLTTSRSRTNAHRARLALACLGELEWRKASQGERVAFLYGRIIAEARA